MKPPPFKYERPSSVEEAVQMLDASEGGARLLAGGQSLVPLLNMRLLQPETVVDVNGLAGVDEIREDNGHVRIGAMARYSAIEWSPVVGSRLPLLSEIVKYIGDRQVRTRGTIGGAMAHADPTGEMALASLALDATVVAQGPGGTRELRAGEFFMGPYATVLEPSEMIVEVRFPRRQTVSAFAEHARRHGDFCIVSVAALAEPADDGGWGDVRVAIGGASYRPFVAEEASAALSNSSLDEDVINTAADACVEAADPSDDIRASADYRIHLVPIYLRRVLDEMKARRSQGGT
jgi:carbon-monoxide dehydrogenase medium subunit